VSTISERLAPAPKGDPERDARGDDSLRVTGGPLTEENFNKFMEIAFSENFNKFMEIAFSKPAPKKKYLSKRFREFLETL
jgi:hypothetical protein